METDAEIGVWWVWWWWHGGRFLGLVLVVDFLEVLAVGVMLVVLGGGGMVARLVFVVTGVWIGVVCGGEAGVCCDWCLDWGCDLIFSVRDERDIFCAWVMGLQL